MSNFLILKELNRLLPMWSNLYDYIDVSLKFIFLFEKEQNDGEDDIVILQNPMDLEMPGLWNTHETIEMMQSLPYKIRNRSSNSQNRAKFRIFLCDLYYHSHIAGIRRIIYPSHHDVIEENNSIPFKVVNVPITLSLYSKIMISFWINEIRFNLQEILTILKYYTYFTEPIIIKLVKSVCMYLLNDNELIQQIEEYRSNLSNNQHTYSIMNLFVSIFGTEEQVVQFREFVKLYIRFFISVNSENLMKLYGQSSLKHNHISNIVWNGFAFVFFFDTVDMDLEWLIGSKDIIDTVFNSNMICSQYTVIIRNYAGICPHNYDLDTLTQVLKIITTSKFLTGVDVCQLILKFKNIHISADLSSLSCIKASITFLCVNCLLNFIKSIPEYIEVKMHINDDFLIQSLDDIPINVTEISFVCFNFGRAATIPGHIRSVNLDDCTINQNETLILTDQCKHVKITCLPSKTFSFTIMECTIKLNGVPMISYFESTMDETRKKKTFTLKTATIYKTIIINETIDEVVFVLVNIVSGACATFRDQLKRLIISQSEGLFDLRP